MISGIVIQTLVKLLLRCLTFLAKHQKETLNKKQIKAKADSLELPVRLIMHGIPESWVDRATADQLMVLWEIIRRDDKNNFDITSYATANGVGLAFGGKNQ